MSTDRELLELAAKAAGPHVQWHEALGLWLDRSRKLNGRFQDWNPLTDDGDALRLACDLGLRVYPIARTSIGAACSAVGSVTCERLSEIVDLSLETRAATRRAIVCAAASIGEKL
jgi:hypothetical protein